MTPKRLSDFTEQEIQCAREKVQLERCQMARDIRTKSQYAAHVTEAKKDEILENSLAYYAKIKTGELDWCLWLQQDLYHALTGERVPLLPKRQS